jgi:hypothetical protein
MFPQPVAGNVMTAVGPGNYRVVLSVGGRDYEKTATLLADQWYKR